MEKNLLQHSTHQIEEIVRGRIMRAVDIHRKILKCVFNIALNKFQSCYKIHVMCW